jgi:hypothetical protein
MLLDTSPRTTWASQPTWVFTAIAVPADFHRRTLPLRPAPMPGYGPFPVVAPSWRNDYQPGDGQYSARALYKNS